MLRSSSLRSSWLAAFVVKLTTSRQFTRSIFWCRLQSIAQSSAVKPVTHFDDDSEEEWDDAGDVAPVIRQPATVVTRKEKETEKEPTRVDSDDNVSDDNEAEDVANKQPFLNPFDSDADSSSDDADKDTQNDTDTQKENSEELVEDIGLGGQTQTQRQTQVEVAAE